MKFQVVETQSPFDGYYVNMPNITSMLNISEYHHHSENFVLFHNDETWEIFDANIGNMTAHEFMISPYPLDGFAPHIGHNWTYDSLDRKIYREYEVFVKCVEGKKFVFIFIRRGIYSTKSKTLTGTPRDLLSRRGNLFNFLSLHLSY